MLNRSLLYLLDLEFCVANEPLKSKIIKLAMGFDLYELIVVNM